MTRLLVPLATPDVSAFAKSLKRLLDERHAEGRPLPSHVELLNLLARAGGMRNFQTLKAAAQAAPPPASSPTPAEKAQAAVAVDVSALSATARKALIQFDASGRLVRLPNKLSVQQLANWALWTQFEARRKYTFPPHLWRPRHPAPRAREHEAAGPQERLQRILERAAAPGGGGAGVSAGVEGGGEVTLALYVACLHRRIFNPKMRRSPAFRHRTARNRNADTGPENRPYVQD